MPDSLRVRPRPGAPRALTAAAAQYTPTTWRAEQAYGNRPWQEEAWGFRDTMGEFAESVDWQARAMSRVRLGAAEVVPGADEPEMLTDPAMPAVQLMEDFCGGPPGHAAFLAAVTPQLLVPGEGWLIAERDDPRLPLSAAEWGVFSSDCVTALGGVFRIRVGESIWRDLAPDNLPMRIYKPHPRWPWLATSSAQAAVPIMRRIFLIDQRIVAMMVSRLAMNGIMLIPAEGTFQVSPQYKDAPDPFVAELIDVASRNIANPGQASAGIPLPIKFTGKLIEQWKILKADDPLDEWLLKERSDELGRLGDALGIARERVSGGMGEQNHWGAWQASEEEIRLTFAPMCETVCGAATKMYLQPMLRHAGLSPVGPRGGKLITWYDVSELTARPDKSDSAINLYDRGLITETAVRREAGFDEADALLAPDELETWVWKGVARTAELAPTAAAELTGQTPPPLPAASGDGGGAVAVPPGSEGSPAPASRGIPDTSAVPPPSPAQGVAPAVTAAATIRNVLTEAGLLQRRGRHRVNGSKH